MTNGECRLWEIMGDFHLICEKLNLNYYLIGTQLLYCAQEKEPKGYDVSVAMFYNDWEKFESYNREFCPSMEIECIKDGGSMPAMYYRYVDKNTVMLDLSHYNAFVKNGLCFNIFIIRNQSAETRKSHFLEKGMSDIFYDRKSGNRLIVENLIRCLGREKFASLLEHYYLKSACVDAHQKTSLYLPGLGRMYFQKGFWQETKKININDAEFFTVKKDKAFLIQAYGDEWKEVQPQVFYLDYLRVINISIPYELFMSHATAYLDDSFGANLAPFVKKYSAYKADGDYEGIMWEKTLFVTGSRFRLYKKYMPLKEKLRALFDEKRYDEAELILREYINELEKYLNYQIALVFDKEIFEMVLKLYEVNGRDEDVRRLNSFYDDQTLEAMNLKDVIYNAENKN